MQRSLVVPERRGVVVAAAAVTDLPEEPVVAVLAVAAAVVGVLQHWFQSILLLQQVLPIP